LVADRARYVTGFAADMRPICGAALVGVPRAVTRLIRGGPVAGPGAAPGRRVPRCGRLGDRFSGLLPV